MFGKKADEIKLTTLIGEGAKLDGDFCVQGSARIDGLIEGNVEVQGILILGVNGKITGNVKADEVIIGGEVCGNILAAKNAELTETAKVSGNIQAESTEIDEQAEFPGKCNTESMQTDGQIAIASHTVSEPVVQEQPEAEAGTETQLQTEEQPETEAGTETQLQTEEQSEAEAGTETQAEEVRTDKQTQV